MSSSTTWISFSCFIQNILLCTCLNHLSLASPRFPPVVALKVNPNLFFTLSRSSCCVVTLVSNVQQHLLWNEPFWATSHQRKSLLSCKTPLSLNMKVMRPIKYTRVFTILRCLLFEIVIENRTMWKKGKYLSACICQLWNNSCKLWRPGHGN